MKKGFMLTAVGLALAMLSGACGGAPASSSSAGGSASAPGSAADAAFAQEMLPHHMQAILMAQLAPTNASSAEVKTLAEGILTAQDAEIDTMTQWLVDWGAPEPGHSDDADHSGDADHSADEAADHTVDDAHGMMTADQMAALASAKAAEFDRLWLEMMIAHHEGAISMAEGVLETTGNPDVRRFAEGVIDAQSAEIDVMLGLLGG